MPYRNVRGVNKGVQDEEELARIRQEQRRKRKAKTTKWCLMTGMTIAELILCLICFCLACYFYYAVQSFRNKYLLMHNPKSVRYVLLPPAPFAIAAVYLTITYLDLVSWITVRPITYFTWLMVATSAFLMFFVYAGVIFMSCNCIPGFIAIIFGIITAIVFLADLICMLRSLKRFPIPYWIMRRKYENVDKCVCTADYNPEDEYVERPICRCGDHWGQPCTCDDPDVTCGCSAIKKGKPPCACCECIDRVMASGPQVPCPSIISTMTGPDIVEERRKTMLTQSMPVEELYQQEFCKSYSTAYCTDGTAPSFYERQSMRPTIVDDRKSLMSRELVNRKSTYFQRPSMATGRQSMAVRSTIASTSPGRMANASITPSRISRHSMAAMPTKMSRQSMASTKGLEAPGLEMAARLGGPHEQLNDTLRAPSMLMSSRMADWNKSHTPRKSHLSYSVYTATVDNREALQESIASKYVSSKKEKQSDKSQLKSIFGDGQGQLKELYSSTEDDLGEGDYPRRRIGDAVTDEQQGRSDTARLRFCTYTSTDLSPARESEIGFLSDPELIQGPRTLSTLPGQVSSIDDNATYGHRIKKNVSVSARPSRRTPGIIRSAPSERSCAMDSLRGPQIIRNVSTTVRAIRTLSKVMEDDNESQIVSRSDERRLERSGSERFPSECTITINK